MMYKHNFNFLIFLSAQALKGQNSSSAGTGRASLSERQGRLTSREYVANYGEYAPGEWIGLYAPTSHTTTILGQTEVRRVSQTQFLIARISRERARV